MSNVIISPGKYVQGNGELKNLAAQVSKLGTKFLVLVSKSGLKRIKDCLTESFRENSIEFALFNGECSKTEINRLIDISKEKNCNVVIGIGGGKILDTAKAVAFYSKLPVAVVPTIASTDAPCSALSVIYTDEGVFSEYLVLPQNPNIVLLDTAIISQAPPRLLVSGMGDALATYFEARAAYASGAATMAGGKPTLAAMALAKLCYETLLEEGFKAKCALENQVCTKAVEAVIEANTLLSGIGFESGGLAAAHSVHNGFTAIPETHDRYHGEKVAFGVLTQLILENASKEELNKVISFCVSVGLPVTLEDLGIKEINKDDIMKVAVASCAEGETIHCMPFKVTPEDVYAAILTADAVGKTFK